MSNNPGPIPNRWLDCPRRGSIIADKFLPFKTPLDSRYNNQVEPAKRFNLEMLFSSASSMNGQLKAIIDLTNTSRFYDSSEIERRGVKYIKMACRGHGETPDADQTNVFIQLSQKILSMTTQDNEKPPIIGVHCTHGFNRTGFLIVSYLVEVDGWSLADALGCFAMARQPGIYKQDYIDKLAEIYNGGDNEGLSAPPLPGWCFEGGVEVPDNTATVETGVTSRGPRSVSLDEIENERNRAQTKDVVSLCPGVVPASAELWNPVRQAVAGYLGWKGNGFAGAQPVSFDRSSFEKLKSKQYMVSWKADGTRYMMYINDQGKVFLLDRDNCVFQVPRLEFPRRPRGPNEPVSCITNTLMDGELVVDVLPSGKQPRYLVYDLIVLNGQSIASFMFNRRVELLKREVYSYREELATRGRIDKSLQPFSFRVKDFFGIIKSRKLVSEEFTSQLGHGVDGLIFQPADEHYIGGRCDSLLKWKPSIENTVDFRLKIVRSDAKPKPGELPPPSNIGELHVGMGRGQEKAVDKIKLTRDLRQYADRIIECAYEPTTKEWKFTRERIDKSFPNSYETAMGVFKSIKDPVTPDQLFSFIEQLPSSLTNGNFENKPLPVDQSKKRPAPAPPPPLFCEPSEKKVAYDNGSH